MTETLIHSIIIALNFLIGVFVLLKQPKKIVSRAFFVVTLGASLWGTGLMFLTKTHNFAIFDKVTIYGFMTMLVGLVVFARVFPNGRPVSTRFYTAFIPLGILASLTPFNLIIRHATVIHGRVHPVNGPLFPVFAILSVGYVLLALILFVTTYRKSSGDTRHKMQYLLLGLGLFVLAATTFDVVLPFFDIFALNFLGPSASIFLSLGTAYAIVRHELLDIRIIIQRGLVYTILFAIIIGLYVAVLEVSAYVLHLLTEESALVSAGITTVAGVFFLKPVESYFRKKTDHIFFKDTYEYAEALHSLSRIIQTSLDRNDILLESEKTLKHILKTDDISFVFGPSVTDSFVEAEHFSGFRTITQPIILDGQTVGIVRLGAKRSGESYSKQDRQLVSTFACQAAVALAKADLHEEVRRYSTHLEQLVDERTAELRRAQEDQKQTMIDISHNLQTPLAIIRGEIELVGETAGGFERAETLRNSIDRVSGFIRQLLHLARLESSLYPVEQKNICLSTLLREHVEYFEVMAEQEGVRIETSIEPHCGIVGDRRLLEELFLNLVTNAITYRDTSRQTVIKIGLHAKNGIVTASVSDNGIGIAKKDLPDIFNRFYRIQNPKHPLQGTGLGLSIVKNIAEKHGATISVSSVLGTGTTFTLKFPAADNFTC